jgi:hypothetical protein
MADAAARGEVVLGGCVLGDDDPRRCCLECRAALWAGGVFAVPGAADDRRIVLHSGLGRRRLEASIADDYSLTISWRDSSGPAETSVTIPGDDIDLLILVLSVHLFADGAGFARFLRQRGIGFVGEVTAVIDRFHFTSDGMLAFTGPQGDLLVHSSVERLILHLVRSGFRRQGYRSIVEFREWLSGIGLDIVRSEI